MAQPNRITIAQSQRLSLNQALTTAVEVLRADAEGLSLWLEERAQENPALILEAPRHGAWAPRWDDALSRSAARPDWVEEAEAPPELFSYVMAKLSELGIAREDRHIAEALTDALSPTGWLSVPLAKIVAEENVPLERAAVVLRRLQSIEPTGLFARDLAECLRLQAEEFGELDQVMRGILAHLPLLAQGNFAGLARQIGVSEEEIRLRVARIRRYDPKPGAQFGQGTAVVAEPDLLARRAAEGWEVSLNRSSLPTLSVAPGRGEGRADARALIRLIEGRNASLLRVAQEIFLRQPQVLDQGLSQLLPMNMSEVAKAVGLHQTTVSRIVAGTSIDVGHAVWWLRALFSQAAGEGGASGAALRERISKLIAAEDSATPLSDDALAEALSEGGVKIARRTIAKYRAILGIPAKARRRQGAIRGVL